MPYGIHPAFKATAKVSEPVSVTETPLNDRILNAEATVLGFARENSLSFSVVPGIIDIDKALATDQKALESMNQTTASYKTRFGVGKTFENQLDAVLRSTPFSFNMDESTSSNFQKVLTILAVSYFCLLKNQGVLQNSYCTNFCMFR